MVTKLASVAIEDYLIKTRRIFHQYPELSFKEFETSKRIERELKRMGLAPIRMAKTGLIADIKGKSKGKTVAIRADIDALPVTEENTFDYRSKREGVMHACGHDSHITMALGAAKLLSAKRDFKGTVRMLFQPAEESPPGGATEMIREGALNGVDYIIGQHIASEIPSGKVGIYYGAMMANADEIRVKLEGVGGHGAAPHETTDALLIASEFVVQAQTIVSRRVPPFNPAVVTFGTLNSGYRYNIIAKYAELTGTVRTFDKGTQDMIGKELKRILDGLSKATGCKYEFSYIKGYPATINNERVSKVVEEAASEVLGEEGVVHPNPSMGGEDFAYYLRKIPGAYYFLGIGNKEKGIVSPEHSSTHKIDESVLKYGTEILQRSAKKLLS